MNITHEGTDIIGYYCMCIYIYFVLNNYYYIIIYGGSPASDILHVSLAKLIINYISLYYYLFAIINVLLLLLHHSACVAQCQELSPKT